MTHPAMIGRYSVAGEIGRGAMGVVYRAQDPILERVVAIKTINTALHTRERERCEERFLLEARAAGKLNHPNIVTIYEVGRSSEIVYMAMEFLDGRELNHLMSSNELTCERALEIAAQVADGLAYAHERGVVHRDIKPANIMILPGDRVKITDFGIARMLSADTRTHTGVIIGSPRYLSPEQVLGKPCDARSDVFSLGVIVYEMIAGQTPFNGDDVNAVMYQVVNLRAPRPSAANPRLPEMLDLIVAKTLAKNADDRYANAAELARDLRECRLHGTVATSALPPRVSAAVGEAASITAELFVDTVPELIGRPADASIPIDAAPGYGLAKAFDSMEAVLRFEAGAGAVVRPGGRTGFDGAPSPVADPDRGSVARSVPTKEARDTAWSKRERRTFLGAVIGAVVVGTAIVLI